jgi:hypothetical protein
METEYTAEELRELGRLSASMAGLLLAPVERMLAPLPERPKREVIRAMVHRLQRELEAERSTPKEAA